MRYGVLIFYTITCLLFGCTSGRNIDGVYRQRNGDEYIRIQKDQIALHIRADIFSEDMPKLVDVKYTFSVDDAGKISLYGSSNSRIYIDLVYEYKWYLDVEGNVIRESEKSGVRTVFGKGVSPIF